MSNHPKAGGSHLPDVTVMRPVFLDNGRLAFWTAARGHHADIGGLTPGSIPAKSRWLWQEGAAIRSAFLVRGGVLQEGDVERLFFAEPASHPGCRGARNRPDTWSDLVAQMGATARGAELLRDLAREFPVSLILAYVRHVREHACSVVRALLRELCPPGIILDAQDYMDDGSPIGVTIKHQQCSNDCKDQNRQDQDLKKDQGRKDGDHDSHWTVTMRCGPPVLGNWNAPVAITQSALIYCLRALLRRSLPLNAGVLDCICLEVPPSSMLDPPSDLAIVAGNVLTSQRLVDVFLQAFSQDPHSGLGDKEPGLRARFGMAASHGCTNNVTFGRPDWPTGDAANATHRPLSSGFYETVGGGAGATTEGRGADGVHCHMTNTRITDVHVLERQHPVVVQQFAIRRGSGGPGRHRGGDGLTRRLHFLRAVVLNVSSERRALAPPGARGGKAGTRGLNLWFPHHTPHQPINIGAKAELDLQPGDVVEINTAGGGGYGTPLDDECPP